MQQAVQGLMGNRPQVTPLNEVVHADSVIPMIQNNEAVQNALLQHLPETMRTNAELMHTIRSPQLQQTLAQLSGALQTDNFNAVMANFQLDPSAGAASMATGDGVAAFLDAVQAQADAQNATTTMNESPSTQESKDQDNNDKDGST